VPQNFRLCGTESLIFFNFSIFNTYYIIQCIKSIPQLLKTFKVSIAGLGYKKKGRMQKNLQQTPKISRENGEKIFLTTSSYP
jgi:hypothetical protein